MSRDFRFLRNGLSLETLIIVRAAHYAGADLLAVREGNEGAGCDRSAIFRSKTFHGHHIAGLQSGFVNTPPDQQAWGGAFKAPIGCLAGLVFSVDVDPGVGIGPLEF